MPVIQVWKEPASPLQFEYLPDALEEIRQLAVEGLLMLPRVGMGVGGLLLGVRERGRVRILGSSAIPCAHASGPGFTLSAEETAAALNIGVAAGPGSVVGWYCSKTRGDLALSEGDERLYGVLCPEPWQIAMLIRPSISAPSTGIVWHRDKSGNSVAGKERTLVLDAYEETESESVSEAPATVAPRRIGNTWVIWLAIVLGLAAAVFFLYEFR